MLSINLRRGLFRLWLVASFVWLVGAGALLQGEMRRDVETLMTAVLQPPPAFLGAPWEKYKREAERAASGQEPSQLRPPPGYLPMEEARALKALQAADRAGNEEDTRRLAAIVIRLRQAQSKSELRTSLGLRQRAQGDLMVSAGGLLLPPILAFALGWAGLWIMRGFRS